MSVLQEPVYVLHIIQRVIKEELEFWYDAELVTLKVSKSEPYL
jgi:hypothetical protein